MRCTESNQNHIILFQDRRKASAILDRDLFWLPFGILCYYIGLKSKFFGYDKFSYIINHLMIGIAYNTIMNIQKIITCLLHGNKRMKYKTG